MNDAPSAASFSALGTTATIALFDGSALPAAREQLDDRLQEVDRACSRFRPDSELVQANARAGAPVAVSPVLERFVHFALAAAQLSDGRVDPTVGGHLRAAGYDRTFALVRERKRWRIAPSKTSAAATWVDVELDRERHTLRFPRGVELDLGATAKALAADEAATAIASSFDTGVLVSLGGDIAVAGPPPDGGWSVRIADDHSSPIDAAGPIVAVSAGGLATSSTTVRRWATDSGEAHHIIDPHTGLPAITPWRMVSVAAATCGWANVAATTTIILGEAGLDWLGDRRFPARCVRRDESVVTIGGWPAEA
jgi:FAD:protein FMN transferase